MRNRLRFAVALTAGSLLLAGCGSAPERGEGDTDAAQEGLPVSIGLDENFDPNAHFSFADYYPPSSFDPYSSASGLDQTYLAPIYDRLIYRAPDGSYEPMLATEWETNDEKTALTLTLREGLSFTDGAPFDAQAVKTNLDRYLSEGSKIKQELPQVTGVEVIDPLTVRINVDGKIGALTSTLAARPGMMVSPQAIAKGDLAGNPVGIGPYTATSVVPGTSVSLTKTADYWDPDAQRVATMDVIGMPQEQTRYNALITGDLSAARLEAEQLSAAQNEDLAVIAGPTPTFSFFALNTSVAPFDDPDVRKAISMAIDREGIGLGLNEGLCKPQIQLWPENSPEYDEDFGDGLEHFPYDPDAAQELLDETDYTPGESYDAVLNNNSSSVKTAEVIQANLSAIGIEINVNPVPSGGIIENFAIAKSMPTTVSGYTGVPDPDGVHERNLAPTAPYNPGGEVYDKLNELAAEGANSLDPQERKDAYSAYMEEFVNAVPHLIPICMPYRAVGHDHSVTNLNPSGDYIDLRGVAVSKS